MTARLLDGRKVSDAILSEVKADVAKLKAQGVTPGLVAVLIGENPASQVYVRSKTRTAQELGLAGDTLRLPASTSEAEALAVVERLNRDAKVHGILVQLPLPSHMSEHRVTQAVSPWKDVDGFHPANLGRLVLGDPLFEPCTPAGIRELLLRNGYSPEGKHVVICGRSNIVGKPLGIMLMQKRPGANATVTICHTGTRDLAAVTRQADILVAAMGSPRAITADMVREGAMVVDVGVNRVPDPTAKSGYRLVGDVDFDAVREKAEAITPVPGGVGPMTIAMLMSNTVKAAKLAQAP
jgi:methylenetetrahydrofolate dehydrogenase (NADP+)/methenyltetrahydrofolate cyclohydrolase